jgi:hypothetical protein
MVTGLVAVFCLYAACGLIFALVFVSAAVAKIDEDARASGIGFRLIIIPGVVALWPLLLRRWVRGLPTPVERNPHR